MVASVAKIGKLHRGVTPGAGLDYYLDYVERGGEPGCWLGGAAPDLALFGEVVAEDLMAIGEGRAPGEAGGSLVLRRDGRVPAWDVTFSAPKSISVLYGLAEGEGRAVLRDAHDAAVSAAVGWLEANAGRARRGKAGADGHVPVALVVAAFVHGTSRAADPDLHTHCLVANLGRDANGRWSSIDSRVIYRHKMAAGAVYRAELRRATAEAGLWWRPADGRGLSELAGLPPSLLRQFSKRRLEIEAALAERGATGPRAGDVATLATRSAKVDVEFAEAQLSWRRQAAAHGWTAERAGELILGGGGGRTAGVGELSEAERARILGELLGPGGLTRDQAAFRRSDVVRAWAAALSQGASAAQLEELVNHTLARSEVVALVVADQAGLPWTRGHRPEGAVVRLMVAEPPPDAPCEPRYTTTEMLSVEAQLLSWAVAGQDSGVAQVPPAAIRAAVAGRGLSDEQATMVGAICGGGDAVSVVIGVPGSGKTYGLAVAREIWEAAGYRVAGVALAGRAADELATGAGLASAQTIDSFLAGTATRLDGRSVVICDEAGMADTRRLAALAAAVRRAGAKLVVVGDDRQLAPVEAGGALLALAARIGAVHLGNNRRQVEAWQREALSAIRDGRAAQAAAAYLAHGRVKVADTASELLALMVADWWQGREAGEEVAMWAYTREAVSELNARVRAQLSATGALGERELKVAGSVRSRRGERAFAAGDEIVCLHNRQHLAGDRTGRGVRNGTLATVVDVERAGLVVRTADGRSLHLPAGYVADWVDHSYAMTVHKTQGRTVGQPEAGGDQRRRGHALVYGAAGLSAEAALVAASRATDVTDLYVCSMPPLEPTGHGEPQALDAGVALERAWSSSQAKTTASDLAVALERVHQLARLPESELRHLLEDLDLIDPAAEVRLRDALAGVEDPGTGGVEVRYLTERLARRQQLFDQGRGDLRAAQAEREALRHALRTQRRWRHTAVAADPPRWLADLLGPTPTNNGARAQLWWEGLSAVLDVRRAQGLDDRSPAGSGGSLSVWHQAIGLEPDSVAAAPWRGAIATIRRVRASLSAPAPAAPRRAEGDLVRPAFVDRPWERDACHDRVGGRYLA